MPRRSDVRGVLVLGKELRHYPDRGRREIRARSAAAAVAWRAGAEVVLTVEARLRGQARSGSDLVIEHLLGFGVPEQAIVIDRKSRSTREEALLACEHAKRLGLGHLTVITHGYHVERARRIFVELPVPSRVLSPTCFLRGASGGEREAILAAVPDHRVSRQERLPELVFSCLGWLISPLPAKLRWSLEVGAGALLRGESVGEPSLRGRGDGGG